MVDACPFCRIADGADSAAHVVASHSEWLAFFPTQPATVGHTLLIPRIHVQDYWSLDVRLAETLARASLRLGRAIDRALKPEGMNLITSAGAAAEQSVLHLHIHLLPRHENDGVALWPASSPPYPSEELELAARRIGSELGSVDAPL